MYGKYFFPDEWKQNLLIFGNTELSENEPVYKNITPSFTIIIKYLVLNSFRPASRPRS